MCRWLLIHWSSFNNLQKWPFSFAVQVFKQKADKNECNYFSSVRAIFVFSRLSLKDWSVSGSNVNGRKGLCGKTERKRKKERKRERKKEGSLSWKELHSERERVKNVEDDVDRLAKTHSMNPIYVLSHEQKNHGICCKYNEI